MTDISIHDFGAAARRDRDGNIRIARDDEAKLAKGTLGARIASWFRDVKQSFGNMDPTRADRQQQAITAFKDALTGHYGADIAEKALGPTELARGGGSLTGRVVLEVIRNADIERRSNINANVTQVNRLLPPLPPGQASPQYQALFQTLGPDLPPGGLSPEVLHEFEHRFKQRIAAAGVDKAFGPDEIRTIAEDTLKQVFQLSESGKLDEAVAIRQDFTHALKGVCRALASGESPRTMMDRLLTAVVALNRHSVAETGGMVTDNAKDLARAALAQALNDLAAEDPKLAKRLQEKALAGDSPLRAIYAELDALPPDQLSPRQRDMFQAVKDLSEVLVEGLGTKLGAKTLSAETDIELLKDGATVSRSARRDVAEPLDSALRQIAGPKDFLLAIRTEYSFRGAWTTVGQGDPRWNTAHVLESLDEHVRVHQAKTGLSIYAAIGEFRDAIRNDPTLPSFLKDKLGAGLDAISEEHRLAGYAGLHGGFEDLRQEDLWRLFVPQRLIADGCSKWDLEHREQGSLAGMLGAFRQMVEGRKAMEIAGDQMPDGVREMPDGATRQQLDADELESIHQRATENSLNGNLLGLVYKEGLPTDVVRGYLTEAQLPKDYRDGTAQLTMRVDTETTVHGRDELRILVESDPSWFGDIEMGLPGETALSLKAKTPDECRQRCQSILNKCYDDLSQAHSDHDKRLAVAEAIQTLYRCHLFEDGNSRTVMFTAMNRLLLDAGLSPAILPEPKGAAGFSKEEFALEILKGQIAFQHMTKPETITPDFVAAQIERRLVDGVLRETAIRDVRAAIQGNRAIPEALRNQLVADLDTRLANAQAGRQQALLRSGQALDRSGFAGMKREDLWRLAATAPIPGIERAFDRMLDGLSRKAALNPEHIEQINDAGPTPGLAELRDSDDPGLSDIYAEYLQDPRRTGSDSEKRLAIAKCATELYKGRFFLDGDRQATVFLVMNRMLLDAGLSPAMLPNPERFGAMSEEDAEAEIVKGQLAFQWHIKDPTMDPSTFLHQQIERHMLAEGVSYRQTIADLGAAIEDNPQLPEGLPDTLVAELDRLLAREDEAERNAPAIETALHDQLRTVPQLQTVERTAIWRLFASGQEDSKEDLDRRLSTGQLAGTERAFGVMLTGHQGKVPLNAEHVMQINDAGPTPGFRPGPGIVAMASFGMGDLGELTRTITERDPWLAGLRIDETGADLLDREIRFSLPGKSPDECRQHLQTILDDYHAEIGRADSEQDKLSAIANAAQRLYRAQLFAGGNQQATVLMVMNRMLLDAGLSPAIIREPQQLFGLNPTVFARAIQAGQELFRNSMS